MFFLKELEHVITMHPSFLGQNIQNLLINKLKAEMEGTSNGTYYIICILDKTDISGGYVRPGTGDTEFTVVFRAVVWRPFRGEVLDGVVASVLNVGFHVDIGPLQAFVSKAMIPSDMKYDGNATPPQFTDNNGQVIERGTQIRVKMMGVRGEMGQMFGIATIKEDYLGPLEQ